jgi:hypothetical protein
MMSTKRYEIANLSRDSIHLLGDALNNYLHFSFDRPRDVDLDEEVTLEVVLDHLGEAMRVIDEAQGVVAIGPLAVAAEMDGEFRLGMSDDALTLVHRAVEYVSTNLPHRSFETLVGVPPSRLRDLARQLVAGSEVTFEPSGGGLGTGILTAGHDNASVTLHPEQIDLVGKAILLALDQDGNPDSELNRQSRTRVVELAVYLGQVSRLVRNGARHVVRGWIEAVQGPDRDLTLQVTPDDLAAMEYGISYCLQRFPQRYLDELLNADATALSSLEKRLRSARSRG